MRDAAAELTAGSDHSAEAAFLATQRAWDPFAFVDLCEAAQSGLGRVEILCRRIQRCEWELLFDWCYRQTKNGG